MWGWLSTAWKGSQAQLGTSGAQRCLRSPSGVRTSVWSPRQISNHPGALSQALDQMETIKFFAAKKKENKRI